MDNRIKDMLKSLITNEKKIPGLLWRGVLWLQDDESLGIERSGKIYWKDGKKDRISSWKGFFVKKRGPWDETTIEKTISDYLLFVNRDQLTAKKILNCSNLAIRRIFLREYGFKKFVLELKGEVNHRDNTSELITIHMKNEDEDLKVVKVSDPSTGDIYVLRVPPEVKTCKEAIAWTFGLEESEYSPAKET